MSDFLKKTEHRKKVRHYDEPGHAHFLTFSCYRRMPLLSKDRSRFWFIDALEKARGKDSLDLWAWVIMPEHVHVLVCPREPQYQTETIVADVKRPVGRNAISWLREHSPKFLDRLTVRNARRTYHRFWQAGPGQDRNVYDTATALAIIEYIHNNPVRRGLVSSALDWTWSSARAWAGYPDALVSVDFTIPTTAEWVR